MMNDQNELINIRNQDMALNYADIFMRNMEWLESEQGTLQIPLIDIYLTDACNANCKICITPKGKNHLALKTVNKVKEFSPSVVTLTGGGEPSIYKYGFDKYVYEIREKIGRIPLGVMSNGARQIESVLNDIEWIRISLNASTRDTYVDMYGVDYFDIVQENIEYYAKHIDGNVGVGFVYSNDNLYEVPQIAQVVYDIYEKLSIEDRKKINLQFRPLVDANYQRCQLDSLQVECLREEIKKLPDFVQKFLNLKSNLWQLMGNECFEKEKPFKNCNITLLQMNLDADGNVYPCPFMAHKRQNTYGNLMSADFMINLREKLLNQIQSYNQESCPKCPQRRINNLYDDKDLIQKISKINNSHTVFF